MAPHPTPPPPADAGRAGWARVGVAEIAALTPQELRIVARLDREAEGYLSRGAMGAYDAMRKARRIVVTGMIRLDIDLDGSHDFEVSST